MTTGSNCPSNVFCLQGNCFEADADPESGDFDPAAEVMRYFHVVMGHDNMDYEGSVDEAHWRSWKGIADSEAPAPTA